MGPRLGRDFLRKWRQHLNLTPEERDQLLRWSESGIGRLRKRSLIILLLDQGHSIKEVGEQLGLGRLSIPKWRDRFVASRLAGLKDLPRPGQPKKLSEARNRELLQLMRYRLPADACSWSLRRLARRGGVTEYQVRTLLRVANIHRDRMKHAVEAAVKLVAQNYAPTGLFVSPLHASLVLEPLELGDASSVLTPAQAICEVRRRRHEADSVHWAYERLPLDAGATACPPREFQEFRTRHTAPPRKQRVFAMSDVIAWWDGVPGREVRSFGTADAWLGAVETILVTLEFGGLGPRGQERALTFRERFEAEKAAQARESGAIELFHRPSGAGLFQKRGAVELR
ncbi:MAG: helix-turn-helix domain-containing protein, partial [Myxococcales bacterium]|nr:helix-turn-helix domain-containing protein [Myxococcales bacterium]